MISKGTVGSLIIGMLIAFLFGLARNKGLYKYEYGNDLRILTIA